MQRKSYRGDGAGLYRSFAEGGIEEGIEKGREEGMAEKERQLLALIDQGYTIEDLKRELSARV